MRRISINTPLIVSAAFIALATVSVLLQLPPVLEALLTPRPGTDPTRDRLAEYLTGHDDDLTTYRARFDGRSLFIKPTPPRPARTPPPPPPPDDRDDEPPPPPPPPRNYEGPTVLFVLGDEVWFHDGVKVRVGEQGANGVTVIASDPPWEVRLGHLGGEHKIVLFERTNPGLSAKPQAQRATPGLLRVEPQDEDAAAAAGDRAGQESP